MGIYTPPPPDVPSDLYSLVPDSGTDEELKDAFVQAFHPVCCHCPSPRLLNLNQCVTCLLAETSSYESARRKYSIDWTQPFLFTAGAVVVTSGHFDDTTHVMIGFATFSTLCLMNVIRYLKRLHPLKCAARSAEQKLAASTGRTGNFTGLLE